MARFGTKLRTSILIFSTVIFGFIYRIYCWNHFVGPLYPDHQGVTTMYFQTIYYPTFGRLDGLLTGVTLASIYRLWPMLWEKITRFGNWFLGLGILLLALSCFICDEMSSFRASVFGFPLIAFGFGCLFYQHSVL